MQLLIIDGKHVLFDDSGLFSIGLETEFNGPFLYNGGSQTVVSVLGDTLKSEIPDKIGGTSLPSKVTLKGKTKFYDWKKYTDIDTTSLIEERISTLATNALGQDVELTIDDFFPMKPILKDMSKEKGYVYSKDNEEYINTIVAFYGGGLNNSVVLNEIDDKFNTFSEDVYVDLLTNIDKYVASIDGGTIDTLLKVLSKCVLYAAGFDSFKFITNGKVSQNVDPELFNENPQISDLKVNI